MRKYENFCAAFENFKDIHKYSEPYDNVILTGLVGLYEICFEQAWKMMKDVLESHGFEESATVKLPGAVCECVKRSLPVILFGSRARGDFQRASDIDLAVSGGDILRFTLDVEEEIWLAMLDARNDMTHMYDGHAAKKIVGNILEEYIPAFETLKCELENLYGEQLKEEFQVTFRDAAKLL